MGAPNNNRPPAPIEIDLYPEFTMPPGLDAGKAPTPDEFMPSIVTALEHALDWLDQVAPHLSSTLQEQIEEATTQVRRTLKERGDSYGEDVIFLTGESGLVVLNTWKALRILWSFHNGLPESSRYDDWLDQAGYATLAQAMAKYKAGREE